MNFPRYGNVVGGRKDADVSRLIAVDWITRRSFKIELRNINLEISLAYEILQESFSVRVSFG